MLGLYPGDLCSNCCWDPKPSGCPSRAEFLSLLLKTVAGKNGKLLWHHSGRTGKCTSPTAKYINISCFCIQVPLNMWTLPETCNTDVTNYKHFLCCVWNPDIFVHPKRQCVLQNKCHLVWWEWALLTVSCTGTDFVSSLLEREVRSQNNTSLKN